MKNILENVVKYVFRIGAVITIVSGFYAMGFFEEYLHYSKIPSVYSLLGMALGSLMLIPGFYSDAEEWLARTGRKDIRLLAYCWTSLFFGIALTVAFIYIKFIVKYKG